MTLIVVVAVVVALTTLFTLFVRSKDIPPPEPVSPTQYLEDRKAAIYENLRDLQFEYRVGKLSDADYQRTKLTLQQELAVVLASIDRITQQSGGAKSQAAGGTKSQAKAASSTASSPSAAKSPIPSDVAASSKASEAESVEETAAIEHSNGTQPAYVCAHCGAEFAKAMKFCGECGKPAVSVCQHCGAEFEKPLKFCGECGKAMA